MTDILEDRNTAERTDYGDSLRMAQEQVQDLLKNAPGVIRRQTSHLAKSGGKYIRARALLACAAGRDGLIPRDASKAAAAVELLHLATLVHDDIIDNAPKRRGIETLHRKFGEKSAVLCGDYLFSTALQLAASIRPPEERPNREAKTFPSYLSDICLGEMLQDQNSFNYRLSERRYFQIIEGKTAALFEAAFHTGFLLSEEPESSEETYIGIGKNIGLIFQLADDCADYESTQKAAKKPVLSDFQQGVITLPLIYALKTDRQLLGTIRAGISSRELKAAVTKAGGLQYTHHKIAELRAETADRIASLDTTDEKKKRLTLLLRKSAGENISAEAASSGLL